MPTDAAKLQAALAQLELERQRRLDEKIEKGEVISIPWPDTRALVVGGLEQAGAVVAEYKARELARLREAGERREVIFEEPFVLATGVPRAGRDAS